MTGGTGILGRYMLREMPEGSQMVITYRRDYATPTIKDVYFERCDVSDYDGMETLVNSYRPDVVVHAAGDNSPEWVEKNKLESLRAHVTVAESILDICEIRDIPVVYISSNGKYGGNNPPYAEYSATEPVNYYGRAKKICDSLCWGRATIVTPTMMYGWITPFDSARRNVVLYCLDKLRAGEAVYCYDDTFCKPLYAGQCAEVVWKILHTDLSKCSVWNIAGGNRASVYDLVLEAAMVFREDTSLVHPVQYGYFGDEIVRPRDTSFNTGKIERELGVVPLTIREGLEVMRYEG